MNHKLTDLQSKRQKIFKYSIVFICWFGIMAWLYSEGQLGMFVYVLSVAILMLCTSILSSMLSAVYPHKIPLLYEIYTKKKGDLLACSNVLKPYKWYGFLSIITLLILLGQLIHTNIYTIAKLQTHVNFNPSTNLNELVPIFATFIMLFFIKWLWFLLKTPKCKAKMVNKSPYLFKFIPRIVCLPIIIGIIWMSLGDPVTVSPAVASGSWAGVFGLIGTSFLNIAKIFLPNVVRSFSPPIFLLTIFYQISESFLLLFGIFCLISLLFYTYTMVKSLFIETINEDDLILQQNIKKILKYQLITEQTLDHFPAIDNSEVINNYMEQFEHEKQLKKECQQSISGEIQLWKKATNVNIARDTVAWLEDQEMDFYPKWVDLLYFVGFSLSNLLAKIGLPLIGVWLLAQQINIPLFLIFIVSAEHFLFVDVQIWYYMRYYFRNS